MSVPLPLDRPVLVLEAACAHGSVAVVQGTRCLAALEVPVGVGSGDGMLPAIVQVLAQSQTDKDMLGAIVCGEGPGSFTSLRIAGALAKGLAHGLAIPLYAVPSLLLAAAALDGGASGELLVHADALRGERYLQRVQRGPGGRVLPLSPVLRLSVSELLALGPASMRVAVLESTVELNGCPVVLPDAGRLPLVHGSWREAPVDLASWEPDYGRLAEAQVKWELVHGRQLPAPAPVTA